MTRKIKIYTIAMIVLYGIAVMASFICDLVLNDGLTWFYIFLVSIIIAFSITNVPFIVKKHKVISSALAVTGLTYLLLYVCCTYVDGDWLFSFAYPIATYSFFIVWILIFVFRSKKLNWGFKVSLLLFTSGIFTLTCNLLVFSLSGDKFHLIDLFKYNGGAADYSANSIIFICLIVGSMISTGIGLVLLGKKKSKEFTLLNK